VADPSWTWEDLGAVIVAVAVGGAALAILAQFVALLAGVREGGLDTLPAYAAATCFYMLAIAAVARYAARGSGWDALGVVPAARRWYAAALLFLALSLMAAALSSRLFAGVAGADSGNAQAALLAGDRPLTSLRVAVLLPLVALLAPCAEELFFRGMLQPLLRRRLRGAAIPAGAALFGLAHPILPLLPALFLLGILLGALRERSGSILPGIMLHGVQNAIVLIAIAAG
jgi:hypothetical protein